MKYFRIFYSDSFNGPNPKIRVCFKKRGTMTMLICNHIKLIKSVYIQDRVFKHAISHVSLVIVSCLICLVEYEERENL